MVNIISRARKLQKLLWIRNGPGAVVLPKEVSKISLELNTKIHGGHWGARKFWRNMLPRIKYYNPSIPVEVKRHNSPEGASALHIFMGSTPNTPDGSSNTSVPSMAATSDATPPHGAAAPTYSIDIRDQHHTEILDALLAKLPESQIIRPTPEDEEKMAEMAQMDERSEADRAMVKEVFLKQRREEELLKLARGEITAPSAQ
ncbi:hypothetical protein C7974DRAFT_416237 [Boeremia exigua]|uniref:uncharacterized protein n=1 Tax=Boeremia exigua TaxID=749465 RepID=UPI001E8D7F47|nr:uncharacterized protein C7974DRAFT_416237 [Boeremia exigua]KAH6618898.1 hypothetical protein C7974DRAFT_416237 [Boeremia exigua]